MILGKPIILYTVDQYVAGCGIKEEQTCLTLSKKNQ